jgi:putative DNA primase/helicase
MKEDRERPREILLNRSTVKPDERHGNYIIKPSGLYHEAPRKSKKQENEESGELEETWICSPIWPIAYLRDMNGKSHTLLVEIHDGEKNHSVVIPRRLLGKPPELIELLLDLGQKTPIQPSTQKNLIQFLMNSRPKKEMRCVNKSGWHGEQYVFADGTVIGGDTKTEKVHLINDISPKGMEAKGTLKEWQDNVVSLCAHNSRLIFGLGVAFSAYCLDIIVEDGGGFNLKGRSSIGKTKILYAAISVCGSRELKKSWRATGNGLEAVCSLHNDSLLPLDEFGQADVKEIGSIAYMISEGVGKSRMDKKIIAANVKDWRVLVLSTGEVGLSEHMHNGKKPMTGQQVRMCDIPAVAENGSGCFECLHDFKEGSEFAEELDRRCREYYGRAGKEFVTQLIKFGVSEAREHLNYAIDDFVADVAKECDGQVRRVARRFALIYATLTLAIKFGVLSDRLTEEDSKEGVLRCYKAWLGERGTKGDLESHSLVEQVKGILQENAEGKFANYDEKPNEKHLITKWGYKRGAEFFVFPSAFKEQLCKGFDSRAAAQILIKHGLLLKHKDGRSSRPEYVPAHNVSSDRFYRINLGSSSEV